MYRQPCTHTGDSQALPRAVDLTHSVVQVNGNGALVTERLVGVGADAGTGPGKLQIRGAKSPEAYLDNIVKQLVTTPGGPPKHLIVFVNGGLNGYRGSMNRAKQILTDDRNHAVSHPDTAFLFINWNSGPNTYLEHLNTLQGNLLPTQWYWLLPRLGVGAFHVVADAGRTVTSLPKLAIQFVTRSGAWRAGFVPPESLYTINRVPTALKLETQQVNLQANKLYVESRQPTAMRIGLGVSERRGSFIHHRIVPVLFNAPSIPDLPLFVGQAPLFGMPWGWGLANTRLATLVVADFIGRPAWESMLRRTQVMFLQPKPKAEETREEQLIQADLLSRSSIPQTVPRQETPKQSLKREQLQLTRQHRARTLVPTSKLEVQRGVIPQFMDRLVEYQRTRAADSVTVSLIGHSMGTIVVSEILRDELQRQGPKLQCDAIVFLAAACQLRDVRTKVVPYLQVHPATRFYNLTLHPYAEISENMGGTPKALGGPLLDGSLLVYIDRLLTTPLTPQERTAGRWHNFVLASTDTSFIPRTVRARVTLKAFGAGNKASFGPQEHGDLAQTFLFEKVKGRDKGKRTARYPHRFWSEEYRSIPTTP